MVPHDEVLLQMEREEKLKREREELEEDLIRIAMFFAGILIGLVIWMCARRSMEVREVQAAELASYSTEAAGDFGEWESLGTFRTTGYCNCRRCCGKWAGGPTASGAYPEEGMTIATDPKVIPLGTHVLIDGKEYVAQDTGSGIYGNRIDIYYGDHNKALNHGVQRKEVFVKE